MSQVTPRSCRPAPGSCGDPVTMPTTVTLVRAEQRSARTDNRSQPWLCRPCDFAACGRNEGNCPVNNAVTAGDD